MASTFALEINVYPKGHIDTFQQQYLSEFPPCAASLYLLATNGPALGHFYPHNFAQCKPVEVVQCLQSLSQISRPICHARWRKRRWRQPKPRTLRLAAWSARVVHTLEVSTVLGSLVQFNLDALGAKLLAAFIFNLMTYCRCPPLTAQRKAKTNTWLVPNALNRWFVSGPLPPG